MSGLGDYRWEGYSLREKRRWMSEGQGPGAVDRGVELLSGLAGSARRSEDILRGALGELGVDWSGTAAGSARDSLGAMVGGAARITESASAAGTGLGRYGDSFARVKLEIPAEGAVGDPRGDLAIVSGLQSDLRAGPVALRRAELAANAALRAHEQAARDALAAFPDAVPATTRSAGARMPADAVVAVAAPGETGAAATVGMGHRAGAVAAESEPAPAPAPNLVAASVAWSGSVPVPPGAGGPAGFHEDPPAAAGSERETATGTVRGRPPPLSTGARAVGSMTVSQSADPSEPSGRGEGRRGDNNASSTPPVAPMPPLPAPMNMGDSYRTVPPRYATPAGPEAGPFGRADVAEGAAGPNGVLGGPAARAEIELPRKAPLIPGLAPPGSLDGPDPRRPAVVSGAPLPPPVDRPLPVRSEARDTAQGLALGRWRGERGGAARSSATEQSFDENFHRVRGEDFPPVHGLAYRHGAGEERGRS